MPEAAASGPSRRSHLVLVGMMGVGKTTVGRALAAELGRPFVDSDVQVEARTGRTVRQLLAEQGEAAFRDLEAEALLDALRDPEPSVVAAAGGTVLRADNRTALRGHGWVVWLQAPADVLAVRAVTGTHRPFLDHDPEGVLAHMDEQRRTLYAEVADAVVDARRPVADVVADVLGRYRAGVT